MKYLGCLIIIACSAGVLAGAEKPNVLFIAVDDLRPQLGCYGEDFMHTPNMAALAATGMRFDRAYCQYPLCGPSRTSVMTGLRPDSVGVTDNKTHFRDRIPGIVTLPQHFKNHGYHAVAVGKIYHHTSEMQDDPSWSETPVKYWGYDVGDEYRLPENKKAYQKAAEEAIEMGLTGDWEYDIHCAASVPPYEKADLPDDAYHDGKIANEAIASLRRISGESQPFFLGVGFHKPHLVYSCPAEYWDLYDTDSLPPPPTSEIPEDYPDGYFYDSIYARVFKGLPESGAFPEDEIRNMRHGYFACVSYVDAQIGKVLAELDRLKLRNHTIVILWGDHGYLCYDHGIWGKHNTSERAVRSPLIISVPGNKGGMSTPSLTEFVDIYPTLCELAGLPIPGHVDGVSLRPVLNDPEASVKDAAFSQYPANGTMGYSVRNQNYRYTEWKNRRSGAIEARALFDYTKDKKETRNRVHDQTYKEIVHRMKKMLHRE